MKPSGEQVVIVTRAQGVVTILNCVRQVVQVACRLLLNEQSDGNAEFAAQLGRPISRPEMQLHPPTNEILDPFQWPSEMELFQVNGPAGLLDFV